MLDYDPVKDRMQRFLGESVLARRLFFAALDRLFLRSRYVWREMRRLKRRGFTPVHILDAGSGFGQYSFRLGRIFPRAQILGLDVKQDLVDSGNRFASRAGAAKVAFQAGDLLKMDFAGRFDLALSVDVLEHIEDDRAMIRNIGASLKPGGLFVLTTPYWPGTPESASQVFVGEHVRPGYSRQDLQEKLNQAGLELERFDITYGPAGNVAWKLLQRGPMSWLAKRIWLAPLVGLYFLAAYPVAWVFMHLDMAAHNDRGGGILAVARKRPVIQ
ncbi:MAG: class I SAM-dependent methyltransferase [Candidatus Zixiibacteriota bacterium]|nr:MAG: class I SAM-dependent methyltransferase [candidate division Zixibacteria bacterium]